MTPVQSHAKPYLVLNVVSSFDDHEQIHSAQPRKHARAHRFTAHLNFAFRVLRCLQRHQDQLGPAHRILHFPITELLTVTLYDNKQSLRP